MDTGLQLAGSRTIDAAVAHALSASMKLSEAAFGGFIYKNFWSENEHDELHMTTGEEGDAFVDLLTERRADLLPHKQHNTLRLEEIHETAASDSLKRSSLKVCSYLAVPVFTRTGEQLGCIVLGHPAEHVFSAYTASLISTVASQAAGAMDNMRLTMDLRREAEQTVAALAAADSARHEQQVVSQRLQQALDAGRFGTWTWNRETKAIVFDELGARLFGVEPFAAIERDDLRMKRVHPEDLDRVPANVMDRLKDGDTYASELRILAQDDTVRWISISGIVVTDEHTGERVGLSGTVQDITERKNQEAALRQSEKLAATGRLAATIAHEINNPLEAVTNLVYLCKTDPTIPTSVQRLLETADNELARVSQIAQQTLGFYRDTTRPASIDLAELLHGVVDLFSRKMMSKRLQCTVKVDGDLRIFGLQGEIKQVFSNLLVNAIEASEVDTTIQIRGRIAQRSGINGVSVLMSDCGHGIPPEVQTRLFSPFFTTKQSLGTGLGLWVTRGIVEKQGGAIGFRTKTDPPTGTIFRVFLPAQIREVDAFGAPGSTFIQ
ncbi:ATP-binding protein [Granulicella cerasi]|uniref:histidine kinase n=1 Tax=Granulicella cerasi TaxID=741063 RepID=A0ABW1ZB09_9BACT